MFLYPLITYIVWVAFLYLALTVARAPFVVWNVGHSTDGSNPFADIEPRVSANLRNQFEWPILFYTVSALLILDATLVKELHWYLAWTFVIGRVIHSLVQILTTNIRFRGITFTLNFVAVLGMWVLFIV